MACSTCELRVAVSSRPHDGLQPRATAQALIDRVDSKRMELLRSDVPLADMVDLAESDLKYTIASYLRCRDCDATVFWGLCIRGEPVDREVPAADVRRAASV